MCQQLTYLIRLFTLVRLDLGLGGGLVGDGEEVIGVGSGCEMEIFVFLFNLVFFILTTRELTVNRKDLLTPTLEGSRAPRLYQGSEPPSCTSPQQLTINANF